MIKRYAPEALQGFGGVQSNYNRIQIQKLPISVLKSIGMKDYALNRERGKR